jgi:hypothetical protein
MVNLSTIVDHCKISYNGRTSDNMISDNIKIRDSMPVQTLNNNERSENGHNKQICYLKCNLDEGILHKTSFLCVECGTLH